MERFLDTARGIFREFGDLPFVHWAPYERGQLHHYMERYGDPDGTAVRVRKNLVDLLPITKKSVALPLYSYSLKEVEKHVGFRRTQKEYGGDWSMAQYIRAVETDDSALRDQVMETILTYNREDLEATWAVFRWLREKA